MSVRKRRERRRGSAAPWRGRETRWIYDQTHLVGGSVEDIARLASRAARLHDTARARRALVLTEELNHLRTATTLLRRALLVLRRTTVRRTVLRIHPWRRRRGIVPTKYVLHRQAATLAKRSGRWRNVRLPHSVHPLRRREKRWSEEPVHIHCVAIVAQDVGLLLRALRRGANLAA